MDLGFRLGIGLLDELLKSRHKAVPDNNGRHGSFSDWPCGRIAALRVDGLVVFLQRACVAAASRGEGAASRSHTASCSMSRLKVEPVRIGMEHTVKSD